MSTRQVEFHQAQILVAFRVVDDARSYGTQQVTTMLLMDTDEEWAAAREQIQEAKRTLEAQLNANGN